MDRGNVLTHVRILNWIILLALGSASYWLMAQDFTLGVILGGLMIIANFGLLQHTIHEAFSDKRGLGAKRGRIIAKYYLRLAAMGLLIYLLITQQWVHPVGLAIGLSILVLSIVVFGIRMVCKTSSGEAI